MTPASTTPRDPLPLIAGRAEDSLRRSHERRDARWITLLKVDAAIWLVVTFATGFTIGLARHDQLIRLADRAFTALGWHAS